MANPLNNSFENWTGGNTVCTNWTIYSVNGGLGLISGTAYDGSYSINCRSSGGAPIDSIGGFISDSFDLTNGYITFWKLDQSLSVAPTVKIFNSLDVELRSIDIPTNTAWTKYCIYVGDLKNQNIKIRFEQHTLSAGQGYYTLIDLVECSNIPSGYSLYNSSNSDELTPSTATASGLLAGNPAINAIDDNDTTRWHQNLATDRADAWVKADLGSINYVGRILIRINTDKSASFNIDVSTNDSDWTNIVTAGVQDETQEYYNIEENARYIRISNFGGTQTYGQIFEIRSYEYSLGYFNPDDYNYRRKITVDNTLIDSTLTDFPIRVKLDSNNFDFTRVQEDLSDIRFIASDTTTELKYELDSKITTRFTQALLHLNGVDGATVTTDSSLSAHAVSFTGNAQLDTAQKKFGTSSLLLDGTGDKISIAAHSDFDFSNSKMTIEGWVRFNSITQESQTIFAGTVDYTFAMLYNYLGNDKMLVSLSSNGSSWDIANAVTGTKNDFNADQWYHIAFVWDKTAYKLYVDGVLDITVTSSTGLYGTTGFQIGALTNSLYFNGWVDEVRVSKNIARYTSNFTPPTSEFTLPSSEVTEVNFWVKVPSVSNTVDTNFYIYYGSSLATNGEDAPNVWDSDYKAVYHLQETCNGTTGEIKDSSGNSYDLTGQSPYLTQEDGFIGKALNGGYNGYAKRPSADVDLDLTGDFIIEWKMRWDSSVTACSIMGKSQGGGSSPKWVLNYRGIYGQLKLNFLNTTGWVQFPWTPSADTDYNCALRRDGNSWKFFVNNVQTGGTQTDSMVVPTTTQSFHLFTDGEAWQYFKSQLDEVRITKGSSRSDAYIKAVYNSDTDNLLTFGAESGIGIVDTGELEIGEDKQFQESREYGEEFNIGEETTLKAGTHSDYEETFKLGEQIELEETLAREETIQIGETVEINQSLEKIEDSATIEIGEITDLQSIIALNHASRIIHYNPLVVITDTDPVKLAKIDISDPSNPTWTTYIINASGETVRNAKDITFNDTFDLLYIACADGQLLKINISDFDDREQIDTGDSNDLINITNLDESHRIYAGTDNTDGEVIVLEEVEIELLNTDFRFLQKITSTLQTALNLTHAKSVNTDFRFLATIHSILTTDFRFLYKEVSPGVPSGDPFNEIALDPLARTDFKVYINNVLMEDVSLKSIRIRHNVDADSEATFVLARKHDELDRTLTGMSSEITKQNSIKIYISSHLEFDGKVARLACNSDAENVTVTATSREKISNIKTVLLPMSSLNEKLHPFQVLVSSPYIDNPYIDITDDDVLENPPYYKGIVVDLGIEVKQNVLKTRMACDTPAGNSLGFGYNSEGLYNEYPNLEEYLDRNIGLGNFSIGKVAIEITNGTFKPRQNWTYFWGSIIYYNYVNESTTEVKTTGTTILGVEFDLSANERLTFTSNFGKSSKFAANYVGTSMGVFSLDTWDLLQVKYRKQRVLDDSSRELSLYKVGEAPYKEISARNGVFVPEARWEDKANGLYTVKDEGYDFREYCKKVAHIEYSKLKGTHGDILPKTSADIELMLDGYYYYNPSLLTRINISNTTTANIYNKNNGFPTSVKSIEINADTMRVILITDNLLAREELEELDDSYPIEEDYITLEKSTLISLKTDINRQEDVT